MAPTDAKPLPNEGTKAVARGVPTIKGGDNSIQTWGVESEAQERVQAATNVQAYLDAQAAHRWTEACSLLAAEIRAKLTALAQKAPSTAVKTRDCAGAMEAFVGQVPKGMLRTVASVQVLSMRVEGDRGFLIYEDSEGAPTEMPMKRDGDEWKVRALVAKDLIAR